MDYREVTIALAHDGLDTLITWLSAQGFDQLYIEDGQEFQAHWEQNPAIWDMIDDTLSASLRNVCRVHLYLDDTLSGALQTLSDGINALPALFPHIAWGSLHFSEQLVKQEDWAENWKQYYAPIDIDGKLLIQPEWLALTTAPDKPVFYCDPGLSFGTGSHETTRLCLEELTARIQGGERILDIGCGSGILSQCALLLGASYAIGTDIEEQAIDVSRHNLQRNHLSQAEYRKINLLSDNPFAASDRPFDIVLSNIVADVIIALAPVVSRLLAPGGLWITSGIIEERKKEVLHSFYKHSFTTLGETKKNGWLCFTVKQPYTTHAPPPSPTPL